MSIHSEDMPKMAWNSQTRSRCALDLLATLTNFYTFNNYPARHFHYDRITENWIKIRQTIQKICAEIVLKCPTRSRFALVLLAALANTLTLLTTMFGNFITNILPKNPI